MKRLLPNAEFVRRWEKAALALEAQRRDELRALTDARGRAITDSLLQLADAHRARRPRTDSGLRQQQAIFLRLAKRAK